MFEVRAYVGDYRRCGFLSRNEAISHAVEMASKELQPYVVNELVQVTIIRPPKKVKT